MHTQCKHTRITSEHTHFSPRVNLQRIMARVSPETRKDVAEAALLSRRQKHVSGGEGKGGWRRGN